MINYEFKNGAIYKLTSPNEKIYIGQTINVKQRKCKYKTNCFKGQIKLWLSCNKYNWNPVDTFEIIEECICGKNKELINEREKYWIDFYDSFNFGLNSNKGGNGNLGIKVSDETKKKISLSVKEQWLKMTDEQKNIRNEKIRKFNKTRIHSIEEIEKMKATKRLNPYKVSDETKQKIRYSLIGKPGRNTGNTHSDETKKKISNTKKGIKNESAMKKIICITNNKTYNSMIEASIELGLYQSKISLVCNGKRLSTGGYKFKYYE